MEPTPEEIYNEYLKRAQKDYELAVNKIEGCFIKYKDAIKNPYQLEYQIKDCCQKELDGFYNNWFYSTPKKLIGHPLSYKVGGETYSMFLELIRLPKKLANQNDA